MSTTGKKYLDRTGDRDAQRVLDARTRMILHSVHAEPRGRALQAYLQAMGKAGKPRS